jgi:hypothetical protein
MHLSDKALLVHFSVSQWTARKLDRRASAIVSENGEGNKGNFNKTLLPTCNELGIVHKDTTDVRKGFYLNTLPWGIDGTFILPSSNYLTYMNDFRSRRNTWMGLVENFIDVYPQAKLDAERILNSGEHELFNPKEYPGIPHLRKLFKMDIAVLPVPTTGDFRVELADAELASIESDMEDRLKEANQAAVQDVWQRLYDKVSWLQGRLADPQNEFRDGTYKDAQDTCELLTRLNFTDDPNLEQLRSEMQQKLVNHHPESLRNDPVLRQDTADEAKAIMDKMAVFMGGLT